MPKNSDAKSVYRKFLLTGAGLALLLPLASCASGAPSSQGSRVTADRQVTSGPTPPAKAAPATPPSDPPPDPGTPPDPNPPSAIDPPPDPGDFIDIGPGPAPLP